MSKILNKSPKKSSKKSRKKSKSTETVKESLLSYQVKIVERQLEDLSFEEKLLEDEETQCLNRIKFLNDEKDSLFKNLTTQTKLEKKKYQDEVKEFYSRDKALDQLKKNIETRERFKSELEELEGVLLLKDEQIKEQKVILEELIHYRDHGQHEMEMEIRRLEKEIEEEKSKHAFMLDQLQKEFHQGYDRLAKETSENLKILKKKEADKAIRSLTRPEMRILSTNEWLLKEVEIHKEMVERTNGEVLKTEEELKYLVSQLQKKTTIPPPLRKTLHLHGLNLEMQHEKDVPLIETAEVDALNEHENKVSVKWPVTQKMLLNHLKNY